MVDTSTVQFNLFIKKDEFYVSAIINAYKYIYTYFQQNRQPSYNNRPHYIVKS